jgi:hypothetical protein
MAQRESQPSAADPADDAWRIPTGDGPGKPRTWGFRRLAVLLSPVALVLVCLAADVGMTLSRPPAARYAEISPTFAKQPGWNEFHPTGHSLTRDRAWRNDSLPVPVAVEVSAASYPSTIWAVMQAKHEGGARPGGGEWETGQKFTSTQLKAASAGARDVTGWETGCEAASDACGAYRFTLRYANSVVTVSVVSIPREPRMTTAMAVEYLVDVTKAEP